MYTHELPLDDGGGVLVRAANNRKSVVSKTILNRSTTDDMFNTDERFR